MTESITIRGEKELKAKLAKLSRLDAEKAMKAMGLHLAGKMKAYPPARPESRYQRTRTLANRWDVTSKRDQATVLNRTPYSPYVQGDDTQAWFHKLTGWQTLKATAKANINEMVALLKKQVDRILERG